MTDREMLELAAKAVGYKPMPESIQNTYMSGVLGVSFCVLRPDSPEYSPWNPLTDDGDALRLAVKLGLCVEIELDVASATKYAGQHVKYIAKERHYGDPYAAIRRAIVRAAAEIGKMKGEK